MVRLADVPTALGAAAAAGAAGVMAKEAVVWSKEKIQFLAQKFKDRKLSFVQDRAEIAEIQKERKGLEFERLKPFLRDDDRRVIVLLGFRLGRLAQIHQGETDQEAEARKRRVRGLKDDIRARFGSAGVHLAQAAQAGILGVVVQKLGQNHDAGRVKDNIVNFIENIEKNVRFIETFDSPERAADDIVRHLKWTEPLLFFIAASGDARSEGAATARKVSKEVGEIGYVFESLPERIRAMWVLVHPSLAPR